MNKIFTFDELLNISLTKEEMDQVKGDPLYLDLRIFATEVVANGVIVYRLLETQSLSESQFRILLKTVGEYLEYRYLQQDEEVTGLVFTEAVLDLSSWRMVK